MKIEPKGGAPMAPNPGQSQPSARDRAIAALTKGMNTTPAVDQNNISPEEAGAVKPSEPVGEFESAVQKAQMHSNEEVDSSKPKEETKAAEEPLSSQYAVLARKEKAIRQREQQLKAREDAMKASEEASKATPAKPALDESKYISKDRLTSDPFSVLTELGLTYDQLTELALNGPKPKEIELMNEIKTMKAELETLKGETQSTKKSFEEQQSQAYKQAVAQIRNEAKSLIDNNPNFETVKETGSLNDVVDLIEQTFKEDGILLTVEEAAQQVEDYLLEEAMKLAKIKKIQQRLQPKEAPKAPSTEAKQPQQIKTLTNSVSSTRPLTAKERAILAFEGKLNK